MLKYRDACRTTVRCVCDAMQCPSISKSLSLTRLNTNPFPITVLPNPWPKTQNGKGVVLVGPVTRSGSRTTTAYLSRTLKRVVRESSKVRTPSEEPGLAKVALSFTCIYLSINLHLLQHTTCYLSRLSLSPSLPPLPSPPHPPIPGSATGSDAHVHQGPMCPLRFSLACPPGWALAFFPSLVV